MSFLERFAAGALCGAVATVPMTLFMTRVHRKLPRGQRYSLPPGEITEALLEKAGVGDQLDQDEFNALTIVNHFAYGAFVGGVFGLLHGDPSRASIARGIAFGSAIWVGSYLGGFPRPESSNPRLSPPSETPL